MLRVSAQAFGLSLSCGRENGNNTLSFLSSTKRLLGISRTFLKQYYTLPPPSFFLPRFLKNLEIQKNLAL
jgi:hypothetical protein